MIATSQFTISVINDGAPGATGPQGVSVTKVVEEYRLSDSSTELTGSGTGYTWSETKPDIPSGKYLWIRERTDLSNNTSAYGTAHCDIVISGLVYDVNQNTQSITSKVWQSDITNKINEYDGSTGAAIRDRVTQTETDISGINTTISNVQTTLSTKADGSTVTNLSTQVNTISDTVGSHTQQISATNTRIDNIKLGTKNYIQNSEFVDISEEPYTSSTAAKTSASVALKDGAQPYDTNNSKKIVVAFDGLISGKEYVFSYDWNRPYSVQTLRTTIGGTNYDITTTNDSEWHRQEIKFTASANTTQAEIFIVSTGTAYTIFLRHFQLELGNIASDWHESPEDVEDEISTVRTLAEQTADRFTWLVDDGTSSSNFTLTSRVAELISPQVVIKDPNGSATIISGGKIEANSITTDMLATNAIMSQNYSRTDTTSPYSSTGAFLDLSTGTLYMRNFGVNGTTGAAYFNGTVNANAGKFGDNTSYWNIETVYDYNMQPHAALVGTGSSYLQTGNWQVSDNAVATRKYTSTSESAGNATYYKDSGTNTFYDVGMKIPTNFGGYNASDSSVVRYNKAFYYGRKYTGNNIPSLDSDWTYFFEIDSGGNVITAGDIYEGGVKLSEKYAAITDVGSIYLPKTGGTITGNLSVDGSVATNLMIQTNLASTSSAQFTGSANAIVKPGVTGTLGVGNGGTGKSSWTANGIVYASNASTLAQMAVGTSGQVLKSNGNAAPGWVDQSTLSVGEAIKATQDGNGDVISSTYRKLDNGIFDSINVTELTSGNLIVTGAARFTNGLYGTASEASKVTNALTIQLNGGTTEGTNQFTYDGSAVKNINITRSSIGLGAAADKAVDTSIAASSSSTNLPTSAAVSSFVEGKGYVTSSGVTSITLKAGTGVSLDTDNTAITSTGTRTISLANSYGDTKNPYGTKTANYVLAGPTTGSAAAPTFRKLVAADIPTLTPAKAGLGNVTNNKQVKGLSSGTTSGHLVSWGSDGYTVADSQIASGSVAIKVTLSGTDYSASSNAITITKANLQSAVQSTDLLLMTSEERTKLSSIQVSEGGTIDFSGVTASSPLTATVAADKTVNITHNTSGVTAGTYRSVTVDTYGHVTGGTNPTTLSGYGITDAKIASGVITLGGNTITPLTASSTLDATKLSGTASIPTTGNAGTATKFAAAQSVTLTGDTTGTASSQAGWSVATKNVALSGLNSSWEPQSGTSDRPTTANVNFHDNKVRYFLASSVMTEGKPVADAKILHLAWDNSGWDSQLALATNNVLQARGANSTGVFGDWVTFLSSDNYNTYSPKLDGTGATGTWGIDISGNATNATYAKYIGFQDVNEIRFDINTKPSSARNLCVGYKWSDGTTDAKISRYIFYNGASQVTEVQASTFYGALSGNATSATKATQDSDGNAINTTYLKLSGGTMTGTIVTPYNKEAIRFPSSNASYGSSLFAGNGGNEALALITKKSITSFMVVHGSDPATWASTTWYSASPTIQTKEKSLYVNELIGQQVTPTYNFKVNGTSYLGGEVRLSHNNADTESVSLKYNDTMKSLDFIFN